MATVKHSSYQGSFEREEGHEEWNPISRRFDGQIDLQTVIDRCNGDPTRVAEYLFSRVIRRISMRASGDYVDDTSSTAKVGYSYACVTDLGLQPYIFLGDWKPGVRGYPPPYVDKHLKIRFEFWTKGGLDHVQIVVDHGLEEVQISGFDLYHKQSHFARFLACVVGQKVVHVYYPDSNFLDSRPLVHKRTFPVDSSTCSKIRNLVTSWPQDPLHSDG